MSLKNGDKARFGKEQKKKLLRRKRSLELRQLLETNATKTTDVQAKTAGLEKSADAPVAS